MSNATKGTSQRPAPVEGKEELPTRIGSKEIESQDLPAGRSDVNGEEEGTNLLGTLISLSGLPEEWVRKELEPILDEKGAQKESLTLNQVREALAAYLESLGPDFAGGDEEEIIESASLSSGVLTKKGI